MPATWSDDIEGKTRADAFVPGRDFIHQSKYQVVHANQIGDATTPFGSSLASTKYTSDALSGDEELVSDVILSMNTFENDAGSSAYDFSGGAAYAACFDNTLTRTPRANCLTPDPLAGDADNGYDPVVLASISDVEAPTVPDANLYVADIKASRTECAPPCSVVFSAEDSNFSGMDEHDVFGRKLAFHWDFDTDEDRTYGHLYNQEYTYVDGDTAYEEGHAPLVTKTFLCDTGICEYTVRVRAQDIDGNYAETSQVITVSSEETHWGTQNTICVSNTLALTDDWTGYDKACPSGATKSNELVDSDSFEDKLILFKRGDVWADTNLVSNQSESNFKIGYFGDYADDRPEIDVIFIGVGDDQSNRNAYSDAALYSATSTDIIETYGWPENIYIEGIKTGTVSTPMSFEHIGLHDLDMDREAYDTGGIIALTRQRSLCFWSPEKIDCSLVPFAKGFYVSNVNIVGSKAAETNEVALNVAGIDCEMTNFFGITNTQMRKVGEHHIRLMGFYRLNVMRSKFQGQHYAGGKQKLTIRVCAASATGATLQLGQWETDPDVDYAVIHSDIGDPTDPANLKVEGGVVDGKVTRAVAEVRPDNGDFLHVSRYQVIHGNQIGDSTTPIGSRFGSTKYQTNAISGDEKLIWDVVLSANTFEDEIGLIEGDEGEEDYIGVLDTGDFGGGATYSTCVNNTLSGSTSIYCLSPDHEGGDPDLDYDASYIDPIGNITAPSTY